jgi:hypothetical protein
MSEQRSDIYNVIHVALEEFKQKLIELSALDLSKIHIGHEWSWMPYVKDHLDFLVEQVGGLAENLQDAPPPSTPEEIKVLRNDQNTNI